MKTTYQVFVLLFALFLANAKSASEDCAVRFQDNGVCVCSSLNAEGPIKCQNKSTRVEIQPCYCAHYNQVLNKTVVGHCLKTCVKWQRTFIEVNNSTEFNKDFCAKYHNFNTHRRGFFCSECVNQYALAAHSHQLIQCVSCSYHGYKNWIKYFAIVLLPLTVIYFLAILLSCNITSSRFSGIILVLQCIIASTLKTYFVNRNDASYSALIKLFYSSIELLNLNSLNTYTFTQFCLHPKMNILEILSLHYIPALYPFFLMFITYVLVSVYDKQYRAIVWLCRPFKECTKRYQHGWNVAHH